MTKPAANDLFGSLKAYATRVLGDEMNPEKSAAALSGWLKESSEALREKVEKEVERTVKKLGLAKQSELNALSKEIAALRREVSSNGTKGPNKQATAKKSPAKKDPAKKDPAKKDPAKKAVKKSPAKKVAKKSVARNNPKAGK
jgi:ABC-type uncharacterized transport system involved in gliding motility auxiliary subunit